MPRLFPWTPTLEKLLPKLKSNDGERAVGMLIWLLEDDESVSRALQRTLRASGYEVEAFAGAQAPRHSGMLCLERHSIRLMSSSSM